MNDADLKRARQFAISRRRLLATACGLFGAGHALRADAAPPNADPGAMNPSEALRFLLDGNARFAAGKSSALHRDLDRLKELAAVQKPFAAFLGCADSRVPIEIVFDQGIGDLFVTRIAGNVTTPECIGSLEFGTQVLGAKVLFVLGHTGCGAVAAALKGDPVPGQISSLFQHIRPAIRAAGGSAEASVRENVKNQATILGEASPVIARLKRDGKLVIAGGVFDLATGKVSAVDV